MATPLFTALFLIGMQPFAGGPDQCYSGAGALQKKVAGYTLTIGKVIVGKSTFGDEDLADCQATVRDSKRRVTFKATDHGMSLYQQGDLDGDGHTDLVFQGYSGGAHCCWTYWFVALGEKPGLFAKLYNQSGAAFEKDAGGRTLIRTQDGAFDYFDGLCHTCTAFPTVFLELRNRRLYDASPRFVATYDQEIAAARRELNQNQVAQFRRLSKYDAAAKSDFIDTIPLVLKIVLSYLYSGRDEQAWRALNEMWPPTDRERIRRLILDTRARGILSQITACKP